MFLHYPPLAFRQHMNGSSRRDRLDRLFWGRSASTPRASAGSVPMLAALPMLAWSHGRAPPSRGPHHAASGAAARRWRRARRTGAEEPMAGTPDTDTDTDRAPSHTLGRGKRSVSAYLCLPYLYPGLAAGRWRGRRRVLGLPGGVKRCVGRLRIAISTAPNSTAGRPAQPPICASVLALPRLPRPAWRSCS